MTQPDRILITGSEGLIGKELRLLLDAAECITVGFDPDATGPERGDVCNVEQVAAAVATCSGIVHLGAVSRVVHAEQNPQKCWDTNVDGLRNVVDAASRQEAPPWLLFASSREVYGQPDQMPVVEDIPLRPVNIYGRSKKEGERIVTAARDYGLRTAIVRLSNVYGRVSDHVDRVVPAFARAAACGEPLRVDGADHTFDFTHIDDTVLGISKLVELLRSGTPAPPPIHLLTGEPTTLGELAVLAVQLAGSSSAINQAPPRTYDVSQFYGSPARATKILDWESHTSLHDGLAQLIADFRIG